MSLFLVKRLLSLLSILFIASLIIFFTIDSLPGDAAQIQLGVNAQEDTLAAKRAALGLDRPALVRYWAWVSGFVFGDMGTSLSYNVPVSTMVKDRMGVSVPLALIALILATVIGLFVGVAAASRHKKPTDTSVMAFSQIGVAIPNFWFGFLLIMVFALYFRVLPAGSFPGWQKEPGLLGIWLGLKSLILPSIALAFPQAAILARVTRSNLLETSGELFVRTARAKGLTRQQAIWRHALRNAMIPVVTIMGLQFSFLIAGAIVIERVFNLAGIGSLIFQAIAGRDLIVVQSLVLILVAAVVIVTFIVDLVYLWIDPRLRTA
ncbi:MAG: ABC transporter permease [Alphaproteobacteria bacterium]